MEIENKKIEDILVTIDKCKTHTEKANFIIERLAGSCDWDEGRRKLAYSNVKRSIQKYSELKRKGMDLESWRSSTSKIGKLDDEAPDLELTSPRKRGRPSKRLSDEMCQKTLNKKLDEQVFKIEEEAISQGLEKKRIPQADKRKERLAK